MDHLENLIFSTISKEFTSTKLATKLIAKKLAELGVDLRQEQIESLEQNLDPEHLEKISLELEDDQIERLKAAQNDLSDLTINFTEQDVDKLEDLLEHAIEILIPETITFVSDTLLEAWLSDASTNLKEQRKNRSTFEKKNLEIWGPSIDLLEALIIICLEAGSDFNHHFRPEASRQNDLIFDVLARLHARACQVAFEILTLLRAGFADGALARWRTLHEITVIAMFISEHDSDLAERYLAHTAIINYYEANEYQKHCKILGYDPLTQDEIGTLEEERNYLLELYGKSFDSVYGWAATALGTKNTSFRKIEESISLDHLRPIYKLANINIHAGSKGITFQLGMPSDHNETLVAGPSVYGLADPGQNAAISINQATATLLLTKPNLDRVTFLSATSKMVDEILNEFIKAQTMIESWDAEQNKS